MVYGIILIIAGLLASPSLIAGKSQGADDFLKKIAPYQGWIGVVLFAWGIWSIISSILNVGWLSYVPVWWATYLAIGILEFALGLILGINLIQKYVFSKNPTLKEKGEILHKKLVSKQKVLGLLAIGVGIWSIISYMMWMAV